MSTNSRASQAKRNRERANREKQDIKRADRKNKREQKKLDSENGVVSDEDPDLAGIVPGPQPQIDSSSAEY